MMQVAVMAAVVRSVPFLLLVGSVAFLVVVRVMGLEMDRRLGPRLGSQFRLQTVAPAMYLTPAAMMIVCLARYDNG